MRNALTAVSALAIVLVPAMVWSGHAPFAVKLKDFTPELFSGLLALLFAVALLVERAIEVVVGVFREEEGDQLDVSAAEARTAISKATEAELPPLQQKLKSAEDACTRYSAETKQFALTAAFVMGVLVAFAGVRGLHSLVALGASTGRWFAVVDILVTGAVIAGGSDGIHQMVNVFTSFMDALSARSDRATAQAKATSPDPKPA